MSKHLKLFVREWREHKGWSQGELANRLGCEQHYVSKMETGKIKPTIEHLGELSEAFGVDPEDLLGPPGPKTEWRVIWNRLPQRAQARALEMLKLLIA